MPVRSASAVWEGDLKSGRGTMRFADYEGPYSFARFTDDRGGVTNPEELIGAAHSGCFSMAFSNKLDQAGHTPKRVYTQAAVHLEKGDAGFSITRIELTCEAEIPGIDEETFQRIAEEAKNGCPVSRALGGVDISLEAKLVD
jgi:lipoyl-dependent peroxiredoxin